MASIIVKPDSDEDFYVAWSTTADAPSFWGNKRDTMGVIVSTALCPNCGPREAAERFERVDATGSCSSVEGGWDDPGFIYEGRAWLPRTNLKAFCLSYQGGQGPDETLLEDLSEDGQE